MVLRQCNHRPFARAGLVNASHAAPAAVRNGPSNRQFRITKMKIRTAKETRVCHQSGMFGDQESKHMADRLLPSSTTFFSSPIDDVCMHISVQRGAWLPLQITQV